MQSLHGVLINWNDGSTTLGVIFPDDNLYVHEPICDTWKSQVDFLAQFEDACKIEVIGPVVATDIARTQLDELYKENRSNLEAGLRGLERDYNNARRMYDELDTSARIVEAFSIIATPEEATL